MFYTIYKITNKINNKIYIGCHKTTNLDDGYMGSGIILKRAQEKYGIENFEKEILEIFESSEEMFKMESILVNSDFVNREDTYNLKEGGYGGFDHVNSLGGQGKRLNENLSFEKRSLGGKKAGTKNMVLFHDKRKHDLNIDKHFRENCGKTFLGKKHSSESKKKMSEAKKGKYTDMNSSQYGTMWIHSLTEKVSKKIKKDEFSDWEAKGWLSGRKMNFL